MSQANLKKFYYLTLEQTHNLCINKKKNSLKQERLKLLWDKFLSRVL